MNVEWNVLVACLLILRSRALRGVSKDEARSADIRRARRLGQQAQPEILRDVRVLIFVDEDVAEAVLVLPQHVRVLAEDADVLEQQIAEVGGIQRLQPLLIERVELAALAGGIRLRFAGGHLRRPKAAVLPAVDHAGEHARGPALLVDVLGGEKLLQETDLVVDVEHREIRLQAGELGVVAQDAAADGVEGAEPRHAFHGLADHLADAQLHLPRRLVGEGHRQDFLRPGAAGGQDMRDARGQHARLAGAGAGQHQHRPLQRLHRLALLGVEAFEIWRGECRARTRADAIGGGPIGRSGRGFGGFGHAIRSYIGIAGGNSTANCPGFSALWTVAGTKVACWCRQFCSPH